MIKKLLISFITILASMSLFAYDISQKSADDPIKSNNKILVDTFCKNNQNQPFRCYISKTIYDELNKKYIAVGSSNEFNNDGGALILTSKNGIDDWKVIHDVAQVFPQLNNIIKTNSQYFAVGRAGTILSSNDGIHYQKVNFQLNNYKDLNAINFRNIAYNNQNQIIATGINTRTSQLFVAVSNNNGSTWQLNQINTNSYFIVMVDLLWDDQLEQYVSIAINVAINKQFQVALISKDGIQWSKVDMDNTNTGIFEGQSLIKYKDMYLAGGVIQSATTGFVSANLKISKNGGKSWESIKDKNITSITGTIAAIATNDKDIIIVIKKYGEDQSNLKLTILKSSDGLHYNIVSYEFYESQKICAYGAIWDQQKYLITGMLDAAETSNISPIKEQILYSYDGQNWQSPLTQDRPQ